MNKSELISEVASKTALPKKMLKKLSTPSSIR